MAKFRQRVTSHDVAQAAGVSQSVVSRAFTAGASIAPATRRRVLAAARDLGYRPNAFARGLVQRRTSIVGLLMARVDNHFYPRVLEAFTRRLRATGRQVMFFESSDGEVDETLLTALQYRVEAMVIASISISSAMAEVFAGNGVPAILFNRHRDADDVFAVTCDNRRAGAEVADLLLAGGRRRPAFVGGDPDSSTNEDRRAGFVERLRARGVAPHAVLEGGYSYAWGREAAAALFARDDPPDAVFCASDLIAFGLLDGARGDHGLRVPDDLAVAGFDDTPAASWGAFDLSSVRQPVDAMIDATLAILDEPVESRRPGVRRIPGELIARGSTGPMLVGSAPGSADPGSAGDHA